MSTHKILSKASPVIEIEGTIHIPKDLKSDPHFILPDEIVKICATRYDLTQHKGIDPMCGVGTIPRVIMEMGGHCDAVEIDPHQFAVARTELPVHANLMHGDCLRIPSPSRYDYIYTSVPFSWFENGSENIDDLLGNAFRKMLKPEGLLIIDSADSVIRNQKPVPIAAAQVAYFERQGFRLKDVVRFALRTHQQEVDTTFTELVFTVA